MQAFFFGLGYSSQVSAARLRESGKYKRISGTVRTSEKAESLADAGINAMVFDGKTGSPDVGAALRDGVTHLVQSIAPDENGDPVLRFFSEDLAASPTLRWLCYYSTVGVYGDFGGEWIDEAASLEPRNARSDRRVQAEQEWRDFAKARGLPLTILRLAGIYGPGRSGFDKLRAGTARRIVKPGQVFNRIHVADIARVTALAAEVRLDGTFNLADDLPAPPQDVVAYAAGMIGVPVPPDMPYEAAEMTPMARSFYADNKRVSNTAIKSALGISLLHPDYRHGLAAILKDEQ